MSHWSSPSRSRHKLLPVLALWWAHIPLAVFTLSFARSLLILSSWTGLRTSPVLASSSLPLQSWELLGRVTLAASRPPWPPGLRCGTRGSISHKGIFLYCIKLAERRFSRCVAVPLASCDLVSQQILLWLWRICFSLSKFIFIRAILRETVLSTHGAIFLILGGWTYCWYLNHYASLE